GFFDLQMVLFIISLLFMGTISAVFWGKWQDFGYFPEKSALGINCCLSKGMVKNCQLRCR
ncbi:MAG: hypothetical protein OEX17_06040, partial [Rhodospirillaceae bacterium]|nr:hypothetical protein [Rhodospirillaceae bacterium]